MIGNDTAVELDFAQGAHDLVHILVAVVDQGFGPRLRHGVSHVAEMDFEELIVGGEMFDSIDHTVAHANFAPFQPAANAKADANVGAVGNFHCFLVTSKVAEHTAWNTAQRIDGRIVGVDADKDAGILGHRRNLADHVGVVVPQFFFTVGTPVGEFAGEGHVTPTPDGVFDVKHPRVHTAATGGAPGRPDAVAHVGIGVVHDARRADVADKSLKFLDLGVATGEIERDLRHIMHTHVGDTVDLQAEVAKTLDQALIKINRMLLLVADADHGPLDAELLKKL